MPIFIGGLLVLIIKKIGTTEKGKHKGLLLASGFITGEALVGVLVAIPIFLSGNGNWWPSYPGFDFVGILLTLAVIFWIIKAATSRKNSDVL